MKRIIEQTEDGSATLFVPELNEHYHSVKGAETESKHIFINMGLKAFNPPVSKILEVGFGTGLNALYTLEAAQEMQHPVRYTGIERYPLSWEEVAPLHYSENPYFQTLHTTPWNQDVIITPFFSLRKVEEDIHTLLTSHSAVGSDTFTHIYFDAFAPEKQPEMWEEAIFRNLYERLTPQGVLTTYCAKGCIRRMLQAIGFQVERLPGPPGGKREILRATK